ncbi:Hypothetical protein ERS035728_02447 [Mycobacterium tuberculosis]|nr:Hypothetical protein ERS031567_02583 [Mycobacterium tuberculosis]CKW13720.1 Hypothetical protein ERS035728_02447 [Mycobacterium tuberculosis]
MRASPAERVDGAYAGAGPHTQSVLEGPSWKRTSVSAHLRAQRPKDRAEPADQAPVRQLAPDRSAHP